MRITAGAGQTRPWRRSAVCGTSAALLVLVALLVGAAAGAAEQGTASGEQGNELDLFKLESQLDQAVVSSTRVEARAAETPAVVTVVTGEEIRALGFRTLADVLRTVPGFYDVYDGVFHNVGVRGINGGVNAAGNVIKLMIDGMPVDFRPTTGNFFDEELIPIDAIERVEIIRGPASALYGANAFLGVINVITRSGASVHALELSANGTTVRDNPGGGGEVMMGAGAGNVDALVAGTYSWMNRSGLSLPASSPSYSLYSSRGASQGDVAQPASFLGKFGLTGVLGGKVTLLSSIQSLNSKNEFFYLSPLSHDSRVAIVNQDYRLSYEANYGDAVSLLVSGDYSYGQAANGSQYDLGQPGVVEIPRVGAEGGGAKAEVNVRVHPLISLIAGADYVQENQLLLTYDQKLTVDQSSTTTGTPLKAGTILPGLNSGSEKTFTNLGAYVQVLGTLNSQFNAVAGARLDDHNIYGINFSGRLGLVYAPVDQSISLKLLYGSSFKAPSGVQLYAQQMAPLDVLGNENLKPQTAHTFELAAAKASPGLGEISANLFATDVVGRVEFVQDGLYFQAQNILDEWVIGGELDGTLKLAAKLQLRVSGDVARTISRTEGVGLIGQPTSLNPLYPVAQVHAVLQYGLPLGIQSSLEATYVGPRGASESNNLFAGRAYNLPGYFYAALSLSKGGTWLWADHETRISLRITDLLDTVWTEPGFVGVDVPSQGLIAFLKVVQAF